MSKSFHKGAVSAFEASPIVADSPEEKAAIRLLPIWRTIAKKFPGMTKSIQSDMPVTVIVLSTNSDARFAEKHLDEVGSEKVRFLPLTDSIYGNFKLPWIDSAEKFLSGDIVRNILKYDAKLIDFVPEQFLPKTPKDIMDLMVFCVNEVEDRDFYASNWCIIRLKNNTSDQGSRFVRELGDTFAAMKNGIRKYAFVSVIISSFIDYPEMMADLIDRIDPVTFCKVGIHIVSRPITSYFTPALLAIERKYNEFMAAGLSLSKIEDDDNYDFYIAQRCIPRNMWPKTVWFRLLATLEGAAFECGIPWAKILSEADYEEKQVIDFDDGIAQHLGNNPLGFGTIFEQGLDKDIKVESDSKNPFADFCHSAIGVYCKDTTPSELGAKWESRVVLHSGERIHANGSGVRGYRGKHVEILAENILDGPAEILAENILEDPAGDPAEILAENILDGPAENILEDPAGDPAEILAENILEDPADGPAEILAENILEDPAGDPAEILAENILEDPADEPAEILAENILEDPADGPAEIPLVPSGWYPREFDENEVLFHLGSFISAFIQIFGKENVGRITEIAEEIASFDEETIRFINNFDSILVFNQLNGIPRFNITPY